MLFGENIQKKQKGGANIMSVALREVLKSEKNILKNLYSLYLHDLSRYTSTLDIGPDGIFEYEGLDQFWEVDGLSPYFIMKDMNIIGFILLLERPLLKKDHDFAVNDLFMLKKYRGQGNSTQAMQELFDKRQGKYYVIELIENKPAVSFWKKIYNDFNIQYEEKQDCIDDELCLIQSFNI